MSQQQDIPNGLTQRGSIPIPIRPRKKAAILITIILLDILEITFASLSLPFLYRHSGYGRRGAWARPWNQDGVPGEAIVWASVSILTFGCHGLSELRPRHPYYTRGGIMFGAFIVFFFEMEFFARYSYVRVAFPEVRKGGRQ